MKITSHPNIDHIIEFIRSLIGWGLLAFLVGWASLGQDEWADHPLQSSKWCSHSRRSYPSGRSDKRWSQESSPCLPRMCPILGNDSPQLRNARAGFPRLYWCLFEGMYLTLISLGCCLSSPHQSCLSQRLPRFFYHPHFSLQTLGCVLRCFPKMPRFPWLHLFPWGRLHYFLRSSMMHRYSWCYWMLMHSKKMLVCLSTIVTNCRLVDGLFDAIYFNFKSWQSLPPFFFDSLLNQVEVQVVNSVAQITNRKGAVEPHCFQYLG